MPRKGTRTPIDQRFWPRVVEATADDLSPNGWTGCWLWMGATDPAGYGHIRTGGRGPLISTHRLAWLLKVGPIPAGLELDHLCRRPRCVNPAHLEPVTRRVNVLRGEGLAAQAARRTHCPHGHPYAGANLIRKANGSRACRTCQRNAQRAYKVRMRAR